MSGKAYSMREMKSIVDYLAENNMYGETRGRKMWVDFANSKLTTRTWQSLKETFLKRILPDVTNPYYRLDTDQILSFKRGVNLTHKDKKLEFKPVDESKNNGVSEDNDQPCSSKNNNEENATGEDTQCSKIVHNRASTETLILDTCYQTAEDIQRDLDSTDEEQDIEEAKNNLKPAVKSIRECIEYTEPLTPMLQEVLDDFATDEDCSDTERPMQIDENYVAEEEILDDAANPTSSQSILNPNRTQNTTKVTTTGENFKEKGGIKKHITENNKESVKQNDDTAFSQLDDVMGLVDKALAKDIGQELNAQKEIEDKETNSFESSIPMTDSLLPNNQEAVKNIFTFGVHPPSQLTPNSKGDERKGNAKVAHEDTNALNSKTNLILDKEPDLKDSKAPIIISSEERTNNSEPVNQIASQKMIPAKKSQVRDDKVHEMDSDNDVALQVDKVHEIDSDNNVAPQVDKVHEKDSDSNVAPQVDKVHEIDLDNNVAPQVDKVHEIDSDNNVAPQVDEIHEIDSDNDVAPQIDKVHEIDSDNDVAPKVYNPCLKSVSLYAEQLVTTKYSDSESNNKENTNNEPKTREVQKDNETKNNKVNEATKGREDLKIDKGNPKGITTEDSILVNSLTSESVDDSEVNHRPLARSSLKRQKDKKLASVFGFSNGSPVKSRRLIGRKRTVSHHNVHSDSSEWTSTSDSEYVSPPHGRRNRYAKKYVKPRSARIMSLEEEGGLFVMLGKKIYPLVKDRKIVKNYVTFLPESDPEEDDSYWKSKYIEERKRTADLKKKLVHTEANGVLDKEEKETSVSLSSLASPLNENRPMLPPSRQESVQGNELMRRDSGVLEKSNHETLKIKFTKNDQEVQLEGHWQHINPVLAQVVSMLHNEPVGKKKSETATCVELSSGDTTPSNAPTVTGVHEKINEMESEIFKEIEEKDKLRKDTDVQVQVLEQKEVQEKPTAANVVEFNNIEENSEEQSQVTQRRKRGRPRKSSEPAVAQSPAKKPKKSRKTSDVEEGKAEELLKKLINEENLKTTSPNVGRPARSPRKLLDGIAPKAKTTRKSTKKAPEAPAEVQENPITEIAEDYDEVRYKFPSPVREDPNQSTKTNKNPKESHKNHLPITSPESLSRHSVNSSQGYQDSDASPFNIGIRRKRRFSISTLSIKGRKMHRKQRSRSFPLLKVVNNDQSDSSKSSFKIIRREQSTISSEVYKSDSYQFLMPPRRRLENIDEANNEIDALEDKIRGLREQLSLADNQTNKNDPASSSIISLPMSPELSIVENLSVSKSAIAEIRDLPTINESESKTAQKTCGNKYLMTEVDVSMPLMAQQCELQEAYRKHIMAALSDLSDAPNSAGRNLSNSSMKISISSESILKNLSTVNVETSDSLDRRLEQLLLESAQKPVNQNREEKMDVDTQVKKKTGSRKRCSTPHKKKSVQTVKKVNVKPVIIEEESKAQCSRGGRRSCPASVNIVYCEKNAPDNVEINIHEESTVSSVSSLVTKGKRIKKDIIKVKILRAKDKPKQKKKKSPKKKNVSQRSGATEGDNESGVFLQGFEDSGDLIHNHSETCLEIGDCMGEDSVEFIETITKSIISLNSSSFTTENKENLSRNSMESGKTSPELHCDNAQCATELRDTRATEVQSSDSGNTVYFTPFVSRCNSALTEDHFNEAPVSRPYKPSKWYLVSDEESNSYFDVDENDTRSYGANLNQIFPIACAVPNLSTITEMSEKNDSRKPSFDVEDLKRD